MKILCVDTSGKYIAICVKDGKKAGFEKYVQADRAYNRLIMSIIEAALVMTGLGPTDIDVYAAVLGPGSFTGIRVGMAVMKAMAHACSARFTGFSSLDIMARSAGSCKGRLWAVLEAGRGELYAGLYEKNMIKKKYMLISEDEIASMLKKGDTVSGLSYEGAVRRVAEMRPGLEMREQEKIDMRVFCDMLQEKGTPGKGGIYKMAPIYIRPPEAEVKRKKTKRRI